MKMSVLVTTFGRPTYLETCIASLMSQERLPDELIIVTRMGDTATEAYVENLLGTNRTSVAVRHARVERAGVLAANRAGFPLVTGDIVSFIDDDAAAHRDWLRRIEARFDSDPTLGAVGGRDILHTQDGVVEERVSRVGEISWYGRVIGNHEKIVNGSRYVDHLKGVNMSFRRDLVPPFDEQVLGNAHFYEMDLCFGVRRQGYRILYDTDIVVDHYLTAPRFLPGASIAADPEREFFLHHNMVYVMLKNLGPVRRLVFLTYTFFWDLSAGLVKLLLRWRGTTAAHFGAMMRGKVTGLRDAARRYKARRARRAAGKAKNASLKRILYLSPSAGLGGAERCLLEMLREIPRDRYEAHLLLPRPGPLAQTAAALGVRVRVVPWPATALKVGRERSVFNKLLAPLIPFLLLPAALRVAGYARARRVDLIHTNGTKAHIVGSLASFFSGRPVIWHLRDVLAPGPLRWCIRMLGRFSPGRIVANSMATASSMGHGGRHARVVLVHDGIDLQEFRPQTPPPGLRASLGIGDADFVIGTVGALAPLKGHIHLIRAMPHILEKIPEARLLIVGEEMYDTIGHRGYRRVLEEETRRLRLAAAVLFAGSRGDIASIYNIVDIVALCSIRPESFGRVLVEGMACERPVVSTDLGAPREILESSRYGILVPPADSEALAAAIIRLYRDKDLCQRMGRDGRRRVAEAFTIQRNAAEICAIYDQLLTPSGRSGHRYAGETAR